MSPRNKCGQHRPWETMSKQGVAPIDNRLTSLWPCAWNMSNIASISFTSWTLAPSLPSSPKVMAPCRNINDCMTWNLSISYYNNVNDTSLNRFGCSHGGSDARQCRPKVFSPALLFFDHEVRVEQSFLICSEQRYCCCAKFCHIYVLYSQDLPVFRMPMPTVKIMDNMQI